MLKEGIDLLSKSKVGYKVLSSGFKVKEYFRPTWIDKPTTLQLDTTNKCNLKCVYCNVREGGSFGLQRGEMDLATIEKTLSYFRKTSLYCVAPFMNGDPLLEKRLPRINDLIQDIGAKSVIDTNGTAYANRDLLLHKNLFLVRFTISARDSRSYEKVHGKALFGQALKTLYWFNDHKYASQNIMLHFIANRFNEDQIDDYLRLFKGFTIRVFPIHISRDQGASEKAKGSTVFQGNRPILVDEKGKRSIEKLKPNYPCQCWDILGVSWKGDLLQCVDLPYSVNYGNLKDTDPFTAWKRRNLNRMNNRYCLSCSLRSPKAEKIFNAYLGKDTEGYRRRYRR